MVKYSAYFSIFRAVTLNFELYECRNAKRMKKKTRLS